MIEITIPNNNIPERKYALDFYFDTILGLEYTYLVSEKNISTTIIKIENSNKILFPDYFFSPSTDNKKYLQQEFKKKEIEWYSGEKFHKKKEPLPVIYGKGSINLNANNSIECHIDILSSAFFMLTRWEEYVNKIRDQFGRFPFKESLAAKNNFIKRPILNEYTDLLWNMLKAIGFQHERKENKFSALITHDVDLSLLWGSPFRFVKKVIGDLIKRKSINEAIFSLTSYFKVKRGKEKDPYDTFDYLMAESKKRGFKSHFYFLSGGDSKHDFRIPLTNSFNKQLISKIEQKEHIIGFHPSFETVENQIKFEKELKHLTELSNQKIKYGRQHFLRFKVPYTWQYWEDACLKMDSTLCYPEEPGFRCGTCTPFKVFNILTRKKLNLIEAPLTAMDVSYSSYKKASPAAMLKDLKLLIEQVKQHKGCFVFLWHNSSFNINGWPKYKYIYEETLDMLAQEQN